MLSFDEFRAINRRQSNQKSEKSGASQPPSSQIPQPKRDLKSSGDSDSDESKHSSSMMKNLGQFLEMHEMQIVIITLIFLDSFASFLILILSSSTEFTPAASSSLFPLPTTSLELYLHILTSFTTFTIFFFALELILLFLSFQFQIIFHVGYLIDLLILSYEIYETIQFNGGVRTRVLNFFRLWRIIRLFQSLVNLERDAHNETIRQLDSIHLKKQLLEEKIGTLNDDLLKEQVTFSSSFPFHLPPLTHCIGSSHFH
jgi:hypothetical protein